VLKEKTAEKQEPFAAVLACADSRVPVELIFDQTIGHIFVTRVAGNIVTPEIIASLEYGVAVLGVKAILVLGHSNCGAVKAAMKTDDVPGQISEVNARMQSALLQSSSTVVAKATKAGTVKVAAGVYDLASGRVTLC
jgi:carbonic anhydrase